MDVMTKLYNLSLLRHRHVAFGLVVNLAGVIVDMLELPWSQLTSCCNQQVRTLSIKSYHVYNAYDCDWTCPDIFLTNLFLAKLIWWFLAVPRQFNRSLLLGQDEKPFSKSMLNRKMVFRVTKSQSMKDKLSFILYYMIILTGGWRGGAIYMRFQAV